MSHYYHIMVADARYHGDGPLTYLAENALPIGLLVSVHLRAHSALGFVVRKTPRPSFAVRPIDRVFTEIKPLPAQLIQLHDWMQEYYAAPLGLTTSLFTPPRLPANIRFVSPKDSASLPTDLPPLTNNQKAAISSIGPKGLHILHGETATGKTRVYAELARKALRSGKSALLLTPEIGLTSQFAQDVSAFLPYPVVIIHSGLTDAQRRNTWLAIANSNNPMVVIGPRSALFSPLKNIGLIAVDESHETAYKQDRTPFYTATHVAARLAQLHQSPLVLGSATPLVADYGVAAMKGRPIIRMVEPTSPQQKTEISIVDLRDRSRFLRNAHLSDELIKKMDAALTQGEQVLLFLNRRGSARVVFCEKCGWQSICPHCDTPLVYHSDNHTMRCHSCAHHSRTPMSCPECSHNEIVFKGAGTKTITESVQKLFPKYLVQRFDTDNLEGEKLYKHLSSIRKGNIDIIIGTQSVVKGLDLPRLGLVGVVMADASLTFPDFSAQERTYQLIHQVLGRVGRHRAGRAIIQTYNPASPLLAKAINKDWIGFYDTELEERRHYRLPPYFFILKLTCSRSNAKTAASTASRLSSKLKSTFPDIIIEGPAPAFREYTAGKARWQLIIKSTSRSLLLEVIKTLPAQWSYDIDPVDLL